MKKLKLLPLLLLVTICFYTIFKIICLESVYHMFSSHTLQVMLFKNDYSLLKTFSGIIFAIIGILLFFIKYEFYFYYTGIILLLGTLNVLSFTIDQTFYNIGGSLGNFGLDVKIEETSVFLLLLYISILIYAKYSNSSASANNN